MNILLFMFSFSVAALGDPDAESNQDKGEEQERPLKVPKTEFHLIDNFDFGDNQKTELSRELWDRGLNAFAQMDSCLDVERQLGNVLDNLHRLYGFRHSPFFEDYGRHGYRDPITGRFIERVSDIPGLNHSPLSGAFSFDLIEGDGLMEARRPSGKILSDCIDAAQLKTTKGLSQLLERHNLTACFSDTSAPIRMEMAADDSSMPHGEIHASARPQNKEEFKEMVDFQKREWDRVDVDISRENFDTPDFNKAERDLNLKMEKADFPKNKDFVTRTESFGEAFRSGSIVSKAEKLNSARMNPNFPLGDGGAASEFSVGRNSSFLSNDGTLSSPPQLPIPPSPHLNPGYAAETFEIVGSFADCLMGTPERVVTDTKAVIDFAFGAGATAIDAVKGDPEARQRVKATGETTLNILSVLQLFQTPDHQIPEEEKEAVYAARRQVVQQIAAAMRGQLEAFAALPRDQQRKIIGNGLWNGAIDVVSGAALAKVLGFATRLNPKASKVVSGGLEVAKLPGPDVHGLFGTKIKLVRVVSADEFNKTSNAFQWEGPGGKVYGSWKAGTKVMRIEIPEPSLWIRIVDGSNRKHFKGAWVMRAKNLNNPEGLDVDQLFDEIKDELAIPGKYKNPQIMVVESKAGLQIDVGFAGEMPGGRGGGVQYHFPDYDNPLLQWDQKPVKINELPGRLRN